MILRHRLASATRILLLAALGFLAASPFLTRRGVGTGEAYNYSLAVADGVTQLRAGVFPVLAGQTPFAFNGRVHPLRNAPYLIYLAGAVDFATGRRLGFSALQNFSLALSLLASFFCAYGALRWGVRCPPWPALLLASLYGGSTALLGAAYGLDLYMTVHAAPFVPLALAAAARQTPVPALRNDFLLAIFLGAAWWAHPPVALWLTVSAGLLRLVIWASRPSWGSLAGLALAAIFGLLLAGFTFVSAFEITRYASFFHGDSREGAAFVTLVLSQVRRTFVGSVAPVSRSGGQLGDFQMGYAAWALLGLVLLEVRRPGAWRGARLAAAGLAGAALLMIGLCIPVPYFTAWAWSRLPGVFYLLTNDWPMQRLYLIALAAVILASGLVLAPGAGAVWRRRPLLLIGGLVLALGWSGWEAFPFVARGYRDRWTAEATVNSYRSSNLDLTGTSYAFLGTPPTFSHGVMEPWAEFRLLARYGRDPVAGNYTGALATGAVAQQGSLRRAGEDAPGNTRYDPPLLLEPGRRYLLKFDWRAPAFSGVLSLSGPALRRLYLLPQAGEAQGFGMSPGQRTAFAISTSQETAEKIQLRVLTPPAEFRSTAPALLADFKLLAVDDAALPVRVRSWLPLRAEVTAPTDDCYLETPRRFMPGYQAIVNGRQVRPVASPTGDLMLPVPGGSSQVELRYDGTPLLRAAFWTSFGAWLLAGAMGGFLLFRPVHARAAPAFPAGRPGANRRTLGWMVGAAALVAAAGFAWREHVRPPPVEPVPGTTGPLAIRLLLPKDQLGRAQPILVTGRHGAGNFVFLVFTDETHVRVGLDLWGYVRFSDPVAVDYNQDLDLVVSGGMLYPPDDPVMPGLNPFQREALRRDLQIELNGRTVVVETRPTYDSSPASITIGRTTIGGSSVEPRYTGRILQVDRLPLPLMVARSDRPFGLRLALPGNRAGLTEPLLAVRGSRGAQALFTIGYLPGSRVALGYVSASGDRVVGPPQTVDFRLSHLVELQTRGRDLAITLDGADALRLPGRGLAPGRVELAQIGVNPAGLAGALARFTGPRLEPVTGAADERSFAAIPNHPVRLVALLPTDKPGAAEPLLVTGEAGRADVVYIRYTDASHVQFGYDHWGVGGGLSPPVPLDYAQPHQFEIDVGSLHSDPAAVQQASVRVDGAPAWEYQSPAYPSAAADIQVGENRIGASSCGAHFTGELLETVNAPP